MNTINKCRNCDKDVPKSNEILFDWEINRPYRVCSPRCLNEFYEKEARADEAGQEWDARCSAAIARGLAETGETFESASDGKILMWIEEYANKPDQERAL